MINNKPNFNIDFRKQYKTLKKNVNGVEVDLTTEEYEAIITEWELNQVKAKADYETEIAKAQAKATAEGKLAALGLTTDDLRALGL